MRPYRQCHLLVSLFLILSCCNSRNADEDPARVVTISSRHLHLFDTLSSSITADIDKLREISSRLGAPGMDTTFWLTNSFYLDKIDSMRYSSLINPLVSDNVFADYIYFSSDGVVRFRIKHVSQDHFFHVHELIRMPNDSAIYLQRHDVILDSAIDQSWRYIYYKGGVGH